MDYRGISKNGSRYRSGSRSASTSRSAANQSCQSSPGVNPRCWALLYAASAINACRALRELDRANMPLSMRLSSVADFTAPEPSSALAEFGTVLLADLLVVVVNLIPLGRVRRRAPEMPLANVVGSCVKVPSATPVRERRHYAASSAHVLEFLRSCSAAVSDDLSLTDRWRGESLLRHSSDASEMPLCM